MAFREAFQGWPSFIFNRLIYVSSLVSMVKIRPNPHWSDMICEPGGESCLFSSASTFSGHRRNQGQARKGGCDCLINKHFLRVTKNTQAIPWRYPKVVNCFHSPCILEKYGSRQGSHSWHTNQIPDRWVSIVNTGINNLMLKTKHSWSIGS